MNPKETAKQLIDKYMLVEIGSEGYHSWGMDKWQAKECSLICCDEIIKVGEVTFGEYYQDIKKDFIKYWQDVKEKIEAK